MNYVIFHYEAVVQPLDWLVRRSKRRQAYEILGLPQLLSWHRYHQIRSSAKKISVNLTL